jgi:hypothetical protein
MRLVIRNLIIVSVLSLAYLFGKHLQAIPTAAGGDVVNIGYAKHK